MILLQGIFLRAKMHLGDVAQLVRALPCHGRGRGFEPRRPRHSFQKSSLEWAETIEGAKGHKFVSLLCPFDVDCRPVPLLD